MAEDQAFAARNRRPREDRLHLSRRGEQLVPRQQGAREEPLRNLHDTRVAARCRSALSRSPRPLGTRDHGPEHGRFRGHVARHKAQGAVRCRRQHERRARHTSFPAELGDPAVAGRDYGASRSLGRGYAHQPHPAARERRPGDHLRLRLRRFLLRGKQRFPRRVAAPGHHARFLCTPRRAYRCLLGQCHRLSDRILPQFLCEG